MIMNLVVILVPLFLLFSQTKSQSYNYSGTISGNCSASCGGIRIPYPFGIGIMCAYDSTFNISCDNTTLPNRPFLTVFNLEVLNISPWSLTVDIPRDNPLSTNNATNYNAWLQWWVSGNTSRRDSTICNSNTTIQYDGTNYRCDCSDGYEGYNPYLPGGCLDINECDDLGWCSGEGLVCENYLGGSSCTRRRNISRIIGIASGATIGGLLVLLGLWYMFKLIMKLRKAMLKRKFFKRNGGLLLKQQFASGDDGMVEKTKLFSSKELEKATDHFNEDRILGRGGQGTVYKGMLTDGRIVAIKMSKTVDEGNIDQFINEVVILSQVNHRNVVKLHGCCLETEVPLLVYEFISNGTLSQYIHDQDEDFILSWEVRIRIATEVASALSYLHSAASNPIYHRDMKSSNILLDEKYRARVADFGTSRSIAIDQTHLTTRVLGTFGYLDPEYFQTGQFTEKSDVYSFGVVLVELLTGLQPISSSRSDESRSLVSYFNLAMEENKLIEILDARVEKNEMILEVANLAKSCISSDIRKRPTMKEVAVELDGIRRSSSTGALKVEPSVEPHIFGPLKSTSSLTSSYVDNSMTLDLHPLISGQ